MCPVSWLARKLHDEDPCRELILLSPLTSCPAWIGERRPYDVDDDTQSFAKITSSALIKSKKVTKTRTTIEKEAFSNHSIMKISISVIALAVLFAPASIAANEFTDSDKFDVGTTSTSSGNLRGAEARGEQQRQRGLFCNDQCSPIFQNSGDKCAGFGHYCANCCDECPDGSHWKPFQGVFCN